MRKGRGKKESVVENTIIGNKKGIGCNWKTSEEKEKIFKIEGWKERGRDEKGEEYEREREREREREKECYIENK